MSRQNQLRSISSKPVSLRATKLLGIKGTDDLQRRLKIACAEEGMTYAQLISAMLDVRDRKIARQRAAQASPLHRPRAAVMVDDEDEAL